MQSTALVTTVRVTWLILCGMMLFSRFVFQAAGPLWMRSFLDTWKYSRTHRIWGLTALVYGLLVLLATIMMWKELDWLDDVVILSLVFILCADGLLNLLPSWFGHFKERLQDAWVKRHRGSEKASDKHLFGTVNFFLGLASLGVAAFISCYKPLDALWIGVASVAAIGLMSMLIIASRAEAKAV